MVWKKVSVSIKLDKCGKIYVAGHRGLVGSALVRNLKSKGYQNIVVRTHSELELENQADVEAFFEKERPDYVFLAAAKVGGIGANSTYPADFIMSNELVQCNVIKYAHQYKVKKLMFLGSSCIYPRQCLQPIKEDYLLTGPLEPTNEAYALAKISGLKMCQYFNKQYGTCFISVMPTNLYGPNDNYDLENSHVLPALIRKMHEAKVAEKPFVELWGTGTPMREFMYVDDMADACVFLMENYIGNEFFNVGTGKEISIKALAELIKGIVGYKGELRFDSTKPDGMPRKLLDVSRLEEAGWKYRIELSEGIKSTYNAYLETITKG